MDASDLAVVRLSDRQELAGPMWELGDTAWPTFMLHDPVGDLYYSRLTEDFGDWCLLALDGDDTIVGKACFLPFAGAIDHLPDRGWDAIIERGVADHDAGRDPTAVSALEILIAPRARGQGHSSFMLDHMRRAVADLGLEDLVAPVRPSGKHAFPHESMEDYLARTIDGGLPFDPWVRVHVRAGATIVKVAPASMRIEGTVEQWREWTGLDLDRDGAAVVPDALAPVTVDLVADRVVYVEPNVWMHHDLRQ